MTSRQSSARSQQYSGQWREDSSDHRRMARTRMADRRLRPRPGQAGPGLDPVCHHQAWLPRRPGRRRSGGQRTVRQRRDAWPGRRPGAGRILPVVSGRPDRRLRRRRNYHAAARRTPAWAKAAGAFRSSTRSPSGGATSACPGPRSSGATSASLCALPPATPGPGCAQSCPPALSPRPPCSWPARDRDDRLRAARLVR